MKSTLKLLVQDQEDLAVVAAHLQDSIVRVSDMRYLRRERRFVLLVNRFCWEDASKQRVGPFKRIRTGLHFDGVLSVKTRNLRRDGGEDVLELLTIVFEPGEPPGGSLTLLFAGDAMIQLAVECLEGALADIGTPWTTLSRPRHEAGANIPTAGETKPKSA